MHVANEIKSDDQTVLSAGKIVRIRLLQHEIVRTWKKEKPVRHRPNAEERIWINVFTYY